MEKILFISYDGLTDPLGQSQVLPYLAGLSGLGYEFTILSFEKKQRFQSQGKFIRELTQKNGIRWHPVWFTGSPPFFSKAWDQWKMKQVANKLHREHNFDLIHCRSYPAAEAGLWLRRRYGVKFLFDMRGFWVDERVDNGQWDLSKPLYRYLFNLYKRKEKTYLKEAAHIISLTRKGKQEMVEHYGVDAERITVIPCCVDLGHFDYMKVDESQLAAARATLKIDDGVPVLGYLGSLTGWYMSHEMLDFFKRLKLQHAEACFLFITPDDPDTVYAMAESRQVDRKDIRVKFALRSEVPLYLALSKWCIFFIKDAYSKKASSPTKQGEIMSMGIPLICNDIGDTGAIIETDQTGIVINEFSSAEYDRAIRDLGKLELKNKEEIRASAARFFDLGNGVAGYNKVYQSIADETAVLSTVS